MASLRGQLLIASPALQDPNFARTVVLIAEHSCDGAMGLVLNRPSKTEVEDGVDLLAPLVEDDDVVFTGGPVQPDAVMVLAEFDDPAQAAALVLADVGFLRADADLSDTAGRIRRARIFAGHAGWGPGQLDGELEEGSWIVVGATPDDPFGGDPDQMWGQALARKGGAYARLARTPEDPSVN